MGQSPRGQGRLGASKTSDTTYERRLPAILPTCQHRDGRQAPWVPPPPITGFVGWHSTSPGSMYLADLPGRRGFEAGKPRGDKERDPDLALTLWPWPLNELRKRQKTADKARETAGFEAFRRHQREWTRQGPRCQPYRGERPSGERSGRDARGHQSTILAGSNSAAESMGGRRRPHAPPPWRRRRGKNRQ